MEEAAERKEEAIVERRSAEEEASEGQKRHILQVETDKERC